jgi:YHS domain-containing protein
MVAHKVLPYLTSPSSDSFRRLKWIQQAGVLKMEAAMKRKDVVCGMDVDTTKPHEHSEVDGVRYHFCSAECKEKFNRDPAFYVEREKAMKV